MFRARGVREVITIDPHTTTMLRTGYLKLVPGYDVRVRSYLEVLAERGLPTAAPLRGTVVIHDSCGRTGLRDDVPHLPYQPPQGRGRDDAHP